MNNPLTIGFGYFTKRLEMGTIPRCFMTHRMTRRSCQTLLKTRHADPMRSERHLGWTILTSNWVTCEKDLWYLSVRQCLIDFLKSFFLVFFRARTLNTLFVSVGGTWSNQNSLKTAQNHLAPTRQKASKRLPWRRISSIFPEEQVIETPGFWTFFWMACLSQVTSSPW